MKLAVFSHKLIWKSGNSESGFATDGGFAMHMEALSWIFDETLLVLPLLDSPKSKGEVSLDKSLKIYPIKPVGGKGIYRKLLYPIWMLKHVFVFIRLIRNYDVIHTPIPSDVGTLGMLLAFLMGKRLYVRHCGNWSKAVTLPEKFWKYFMEKNAGGNNLMLTTGGGNIAPSIKNPNVHWIFSSSLKSSEILELKNNRKILNLERIELVIVARQEKEKGTDKVLEALSLLNKNSKKYYLTIVGDGNYLNQLKHIAQNLKIEEYCNFTGKLKHKEVLDVLKSSDIFVYPTTASEGFPKVILEALASGKVVISNPVSIIGELLADGRGVILNSDNSENISRQIDLIITDSNKYKKMQNEAQSYVENYSLEKWSDEIKSTMESQWGKIM